MKKPEDRSSRNMISASVIQIAISNRNCKLWTFKNFLSFQCVWNDSSISFLFPLLSKSDFFCHASLFLRDKLRWYILIQSRIWRTLQHPINFQLQLFDIRNSCIEEFHNKKAREFEEFFFNLVMQNLQTDIKLRISVKFKTNNWKSWLFKAREFEKILA